MTNADPKFVLNSSKTELVNYWVKEAYIEPLEIKSDEKYIDNKKQIQYPAYDCFDKSPYNVPGTSIEICIPFTGDKKLFQLRASTFSYSGYPDIEINGNLVIMPMTYQDSNADGEKIKTQIESGLKSIMDEVGYINKDVEGYNKKLDDTIKDIVESKINRSQKSLDAILNLGIPIKRKDIPDAFVVDAKRKVASKSFDLPKARNDQYRPEPALDNKEYLHILEVLKSMSLVIERNPDAFADLDEEAIRTHFLLQLNGHYEGKATGETFNKSGKTDILIREGDKNIFIAECKFWRGEKSFTAAIDQLLGYLSWRDTKCALLIFNKTQNSTEVSKKMHAIMSGRSECKKVIDHNIQGDSRYVFVKESDPGKEIIITTQIYDISKRDE